LEHVVTDFAEAPLDEDDQAIMARVAALLALLDPPPSDLDDRVRFAVALQDVDVEIARLSEDVLVGSGARSSERTRTITFDAASRTVMVTVVDRPDNLVRVDGWLAPGEALRVELRLPEPAPAQVTIADDNGRFVFDAIPHGLAQLLVHPGDGDGAPRVVTPTLML
jgi:hypothetical protein